MKKITTTLLVLASCIIITSCKSYYPASSESAYKETTKSIRTVMLAEGYTLTGQSTENGYHDKERYVYSNANGDQVQFTLEIHRGENGGNVFIDEVNVVGCSTSNPGNYYHYCGSDGIPQQVIKNTLKKDTTGSKISPGKTVGAVIGGSSAFVALIILLEVALIKSATNIR